MSKNILLTTFATAIFALPLYGGDGGGHLSLQQCIDYAIENNITVKRQEQVVENDRIALNSSRNNRLPGVSASASHSFNFGRGLTIDNTYANRNTMNTSMDINANMMLYSGGQISRDIEVKQLNLQASIADLSRVKDDIVVQVIAAYMEALYQKRLVDIAHNQLQLSETQARRIKALVDNGKRAEADYAEAEATIAADRLTLVQNENGYQLAILALTQLLELPSPDGFAIDSTMPDMNPASTILPTADDIYAQAVQLRPTIKAGEYRLQSAERSIALARSGYLPTLSVGAGLSSGYYKTFGFDASTFGRQLSDNFNKYVGVNLSIPVFNRFATRNQIRQAKVQQVSQQLQLDDTKKALYKEIQQAYYNAMGAQRQCESSVVAERAAQTAFDLTVGKYDNGKATATDFEEAKTRLVRAQADNAQAQCTFYFRHMLLKHYAEPIHE